MALNRMITIENAFLKVSCKPEGAELTGIFSKQTGLEYLWQAGKEWTKHAPVLFPIVGQLKDNTYYHKEKDYKLERHGFARNLKFEIEDSKTDCVTFILKSNSETLKIFPFEFALRITYSLSYDKLSVEYKVENTGYDEMYFSIGAHPAFKIPYPPSPHKGVYEYENYDDYFLEFSEKENAPRWLLQSGLIAESESFLLNQSILPLTKKLFYNDALVFKILKSETISIKSKKSSNGLYFHCKGFPYFGIWAAKDADFVCLEPWCGIADSINTNQQLQDKEGINKLNSGENFVCQYSIQPF